MHRDSVQRRSFAALLALALTMVPAAAVHAAPARGPADPLAGLQIEIPATKLVLKNGLTLIVHEDHSAPLVAVHIWYHVGSKNEPRGKAGFAHLFEHLMFNGSENLRDDFFTVTQKIGATEQNGTTSHDRTNYFQTVPKAALDSILWLESDRMGHLLGAVDQARLDEQRAVVKNEKRQRLDNAPYGKAWELITRSTTPMGHPYDHLPIGSMEDLDAASLDDVKEWFRTYYGPSNAVLVLSGDISVEEAKAKVEKYFGDIPPGSPVSQPRSWVVKRSGTVRETAFDRVAQPRLYRVWNISDYASPDTDYLQFLGELLAGDANSRLHKRLVIEEQVATSVAAGVDNREIGGQFVITADLKPGIGIDRVERMIEEELQALMARGPAAAEMGRVRTTTLAGFARSLESIARKASYLAESETYLGSPDAWKASFERLRTAAPADIRRVARHWLSDGDYVLHVLPFGELKASTAGADRSVMPMPGATVAATFPAVERAELSNGMKVVVARRTGVPVVNFTLLLDTGIPEDFVRIAPGTGELTMSLLDEGTTSRSREQIAETLGVLGATLEAGGGGETSYVGLSALKPVLGQALAIYADVVMHPAFAQTELERVKAQSLAAIAASRQDPGRAANRVLPKLVLGPNNPYGRIATEVSLQSIGRSEVSAFHQRWFHPNNATLIVAGDTSLEEIRPKIEAAFGAWKPGVVPRTIAPVSSPPATSVVYLIDKPGTAQSVVQAALLAPPLKTGDEIARQALNTAFGGGFVSRLNLKLREEKGWSYGAHSAIGDNEGSRIFSAGAAVQTDKTAESMSEIATLLQELTGKRKVAQEELLAAKDAMSLGLSSAWSTSFGVAQYLAKQSVYGLPDNYYALFPQNVSAITLDAVRAAAQEFIADRPPVWIVVGDRARIESAVRALRLGELRVIDADGNPAASGIHETS